MLEIIIYHIIYYIYIIHIMFMTTLIPYSEKIKRDVDIVILLLIMLN